MHKSGIYVIRNKETGRIYIGSSQDIQKRWSAHRLALKNGRHHSKRLQRSWTKHGSQAFVFAILEFVPEHRDLWAREQEWLDHFQPYNSTGYNIFHNARGPRGHKFSDETRLLLSKIRKGKKRPPVSDQHRERMSASAKLRKTTAETKAKMSAARKGRKLGPFSEQHKENIRRAKTPEIRAAFGKRVKARHDKAKYGDPRQVALMI